MDYLVIVVAIVAIILVFLSKFYGLSIIFPTLLIVLAIIMYFLSSSLKSRKDKKKFQDVEKYIKENNAKEKLK